MSSCTIVNGAAMVASWRQRISALLYIFHELRCCYTLNEPPAHCIILRISGPPFHAHITLRKTTPNKQNTDSIITAKPPHIPHPSNLHHLTVSRRNPTLRPAKPHRRSPPIITRSRRQPAPSRTSSFAHSADHTSPIPTPQITPSPSPSRRSHTRPSPSRRSVPHDPLASSPSRPVRVPRPFPQEMY
jgi:hypothetical protein